MNTHLIVKRQRGIIVQAQ